MAVRATKKIDFAHVATMTVAASQTTTAGRVQKFAAADNQVQDSTATDDNIVGIALDSGTGGQRVRVLLPGPIVPMVVGTGGTTRGKKQIMAANGITDAPAHQSNGATNNIIVAVAFESGVAGDLVGAIPTFTNRGSP